MRQFSNNKTAAKIWDSSKMFENLSDYPERFATESAMKRRCKELGVTSGAFL